MPVKNYRSVTLRDSVVEKLEAIACETKRSVPKVIEHMLEVQYPHIASRNKVDND